jgi:hypothetical protein
VNDSTVVALNKGGNHRAGFINLGEHNEMMPPWWVYLFKLRQDTLAFNQVFGVFLSSHSFTSETWNIEPGNQQTEQSGDPF